MSEPPPQLKEMSEHMRAISHTQNKICDALNSIVSLLKKSNKLVPELGTDDQGNPYFVPKGTQVIDLNNQSVKVAGKMSTKIDVKKDFVIKR